MQNKDKFFNYETARYTYDNCVVPKYGATRMEYGFGRWLWMEFKEDEIEYWKDMDEIGILTSAGRKMLLKAIRHAHNDFNAGQRPVAVSCASALPAGGARDSASNNQEGEPCAK